ncbi:MAG: S-layer homology domain-containing protein [Clostridiales bacterium]|nr:S-layer homology domain-containing protein [Clostridiales bacterium]
MKFSRKLIAIILGLSLAIGSSPNSFAANGDVEGHWAQQTFEKWISLGLINGYENGNYRPDGLITRAEFIKLVNETKGYTETSDKVSKFKDVKPGAWHYNDIAKSLAAGYISGTSDTTMSPDARITREEAIAIVGRVEGLEKEPGTSVLSEAKDGGSVSGWARKDVANAVNAGLIMGDSGKLNPKSSMTRAEALILLDRIRTGTRVYAFAGSYGPSEGTSEINGSVTISAPGVAIRNATVEKDFTIASEVGEGDVDITNVHVKGDAYIEGGGENTIRARNFRVDGNVFFRKRAGTVRLVASGDCRFKAILQTSARLALQDIADGASIDAEIPEDFLAGSKFELSGKFNNVTNYGKGSAMAVSGSISKLTLYKPMTVTGNGSIDVADIKAGAGVGTSFETTPKSLTGEGKADVKLPIPTPASPGSSSSGGSSSNEGGGNNSGGGTETPSLSIESVERIEATVDQGGSYALPEKVQASLSNGSKKDFSVSWAPATADTSECGKFEFIGTLQLPTGYTNAKGAVGRVVLTVNPVLSALKITALPVKTLYLQGEELDLSGIVVKEVYSDTSEKYADTTLLIVSGYDKNALGEQTVTVSLGDLSAEFIVSVYQSVANGELLSITSPSALSVSNAAEKSVAGLKLPPKVEIEAEVDATPVKTLADVNWNLANLAYDPELKTKQELAVPGTVLLPENVLNTSGTSLDVTALVTVEAAEYEVSFDLNGHLGKSIPSRLVKHGDVMAEPEKPADLAETKFAGWYTDEALSEPYNWNEAVTKNLVLYAKYTINLSVVLDALTFDVIRGNNINAQSVVDNLVLPDRLEAYPDALISWKSSDESVLANDGTVTRPPKTGFDADISITATISYGVIKERKTFYLSVRKIGKEDVLIEIENVDERYAPGYPRVVIGKYGSVTLKIRLNPNIASPEHPIVAYISCSSYPSSSFDKESVLDGVGIIENSDVRHPELVDNMPELFIVDSEEHDIELKLNVNIWTYKSSAGIVLLKDDDEYDPLAKCTAIYLRGEKEPDKPWIDTSFPLFNSAYASEDGKIIYINTEELSLEKDHCPDNEDFSLIPNIASVTKVNMDKKGISLNLDKELPFNSDVILEYTPGSKNLCDISGNLVTERLTEKIGFIDGLKLEAFYNPNYGRLKVIFNPGLMFGEGKPDFYKTMLLRFKGLELAKQAINYTNSGAFMGDLYSVFKTAYNIPEMGVHISENDFTVDINEELTLFNMKKVIIQNHVIDHMITNNLFDGLVVRYDVVKSRLVFDFPSDSYIEREDLRVYPCNINIYADGIRLRNRNSVIVDKDTNDIYIQVSEYLKNKMENASKLQIEYKVNELYEQFGRYNAFHDESGAPWDYFACIDIAR